MVDPVKGSHLHRLEEVEALFVLDGLPGVGPGTVRRLVDVFGSARSALRARRGDFASVAGPEAAEGRRDAELRELVGAALERARDLGMRTVVMGDEEYPRRLLHLADPPSVLFLRGDPGLLGRDGIAVVGARKATARGRDVARALGRALGRRSVTVVSGMALGVDGAAHRGALEVDGPTVAVLGRGADAPYPRSHARLFRQILDSGLVVSEFLPGTPPLPHHFPRRNRILAALARAVVVVEAGRRSGALITMEHGLDLGLDIFAVPGPIDAPTCRGSNALLLDGARAVVDVEAFARQVAGGDGAEEPSSSVPDGVPGRVLEGLGGEVLHVDEVARRAGLDVSRALFHLSTLEMDGWVERVPGMRFRRAG